MEKTYFKDHCDTLAFGIVPAYRRYELYYARFDELAAAMAPMLKPDRALRILDVGSGTGDAKRFVDSRGGGAVVCSRGQSSACRTLPEPGLRRGRR